MNTAIPVHPTQLKRGDIIQGIRVRDVRVTGTKLIPRHVVVRVTGTKLIPRHVVRDWSVPDRMQVNVLDETTRRKVFFNLSAEGSLRERFPLKVIPTEQVPVNPKEETLAQVIPEEGFLMDQANDIAYRTGDAVVWLRIEGEWIENPILWPWHTEAHRPWRVL